MGFCVNQVCSHYFMAQRQKFWHDYRGDASGRKIHRCMLTMGVPGKPEMGKC